VPNHSRPVINDCGIWGRSPKYRLGRYAPHNIDPSSVMFDWERTKGRRTSSHQGCSIAIRGIVAAAHTRRFRRAETRPETAGLEAVLGLETKDSMTSQQSILCKQALTGDGEDKSIYEVTATREAAVRVSFRLRLT
jgi:hypothetical protein